MFKRVYTYKLRPNRQQREKLTATLELCRNLYNCALEQRKVQRINLYEQKRQLVELKQAFPEYRAIHAHVVQNVIFCLDRSFQNFFRRIQNGEKPGFSRFKSRDRYDSFEFNNTGFSLEGNRLQISKIGIENLRIQGLSQGFLAKQVQDAGWSTFLRMLLYKAEGAGRVAVGVDCRTQVRRAQGAEKSKRSRSENACIDAIVDSLRIEIPQRLW